MTTVCAACRGEAHTFCYLDSFVQNHEILLKDMLFDVCGVFALEGEFLCEDCYEKMYDAYAFKRRYLAVQEELQVRRAEPKKESIQQPTLRRDERKRYACDECVYETDIKSVITRHNKAHEKQKKFMCNLRRYATTLTSLLDKRKHEIVEKYPTLPRNEFFNSKTGSESNSCNRIFIRENATKFTCKFCKYETGLVSEFCEHVRVHKNDVEKDPMFTCKFCKYETSLVSDLNDHVRIHENVKNTTMFTCKLCKFETSLMSDLYEHIVVHRNAEKGKICNYETNQTSNFIEHVPTHESVKDAPMFTCKVCNYETKQVFDLNEHILTHESVKDAPTFTCKVCNYETKLVTDFNKHILRHNYENTLMLTCKICNYEAKRVSDLNKHVLTHESVKDVPKFTCKVCNYKTKWKVAFNKHIVRHENDIKEVKTFSCKFCNYATSSGTDLKEHILTHQNVKSVTMFTWKNDKDTTNMVRGLKQTTMNNIKNIAKFNCRFCEYSTNMVENIEQHMLTHENVKSFKTISCSGDKDASNVVK